MIRDFGLSIQRPPVGFAVWILTSLLLLSSCSSRPSISNVEVPLNLLFTILKGNIPGGVRDYSANGRTLRSHYFNPNDWDEDAEDAKTRAYTTVTVNGSSRPYNLVIKAFRERKAGDSYTATPDEALSKRITQRLKSAIQEDRMNRNVIDDFRAF